MAMSIKKLILVSFIIGVYVSSTWSMFGSARPCEILVARQTDYQVSVAERKHQEELRSLQELARTALPAKNYEGFVRNVDEYANTFARRDNLRRTVIEELRRSVSTLTTFQCGWQALTWDPPI
jgi:hypothetical protein